MKPVLATKNKLFEKPRTCPGSITTDQQQQLDTDLGILHALCIPGEPITEDEIAEAVGCSRQYVAYVVDRALMKLSRLQRMRHLYEEMFAMPPPQHESTTDRDERISRERKAARNALAVVAAAPCNCNHVARWKDIAKWMGLSISSCIAIYRGNRGQVRQEHAERLAHILKLEGVPPTRQRRQIV
jgi:hypothetical protein